MWYLLPFNESLGQFWVPVLHMDVFITTQKCCLVLVSRIHLLINGSFECPPFETFLINFINTSYRCFYLASSNLLYFTFLYGTDFLSLKFPVISWYLCLIWMCYYAEMLLGLSSNNFIYLSP